MYQLLIKSMPEYGYHKPINRRSLEREQWQAKNPPTTTSVSVELAIGLIGPTLAVIAYA